MDLGSGIWRKRYTWFAWGVLAYNIPVILWGAYVRASFSGDGCGARWPTCDGQMLPSNMAPHKLIEFTHRMMTGVDSALVIALCVLAFVLFEKRHAVRRFASFSLVFLFIEALLGAGLVLLRKVAHDQSMGRAWYLSAHLTNTMLLLGALTVTAWASYRERGVRVSAGAISGGLWGCMLVTIFVSVTGAMAALGDTLYPAVSLSAGMQQDFASGSSMLLRLRLLHPAMAVLGAAFLIWTAYRNPARAAAARLIWLVVFQVALGAMNLTLLAPLWMQTIHLLMADLVWIATVLLVCESVQSGDRAVDRQVPLVIANY